MHGIYLVLHHNYQYLLILGRNHLHINGMNKSSLYLSVEMPPQLHLHGVHQYQHIKLFSKLLVIPGFQ